MTTPKQALEAARKCIWSGGDSLATVAIIDEALASIQGEDAVERMAQALLDRFIERSKCRSLSGKPTFRDGTKITELPASYRDDFEADARAILATGIVPDAAAIAKLVAETGSRDVEDLKDMALIGQSTMEAIEAVVTSDGPFKGWSPAQDPAEIITDLFGALTDGPDEAAIRADEREKCAAEVEALEDCSPQYIASAIRAGGGE